MLNKNSLSKKREEKKKRLFKMSTPAHGVSSQSACTSQSYEDTPCQIYEEHIKYMIWFKKKKIEVRCLHTIS